MTRAGKKIRSDKPERRCIVSRESLPKTNLIRFVVSPDGIVTPDIEEKLPGRGCYVKPDPESLKVAVQKNLFSRSMKSLVKVPPDLADSIDTGLIRRISGLLGLARKSGQAVAGYDRVKEFIALNSSAILLQASDGSARQCMKLNRHKSAATVYFCLTRCELGFAFGRESVVNAAVKKGGLSSALVRELGRLASLRGVSHMDCNLHLEPAMM